MRFVPTVAAQAMYALDGTGSPFPFKLLLARAPPPPCWPLGVTAVLAAGGGPAVAGGTPEPRDRRLVVMQRSRGPACGASATVVPTAAGPCCWRW